MYKLDDVEIRAMEGPYHHQDFLFFFMLKMLKFLMILAVCLGSLSCCRIILGPIVTPSRSYCMMDKHGSQVSRIVNSFTHSHAIRGISHAENLLTLLKRNDYSLNESNAE